MCVDAAADLQQSVGGVETVFESSAGKMKQWSDNAAQAVGLSKNEYNEFATLVGSQLQNFGMSVDESADKTNELITLGADLSSMVRRHHRRRCGRAQRRAQGRNGPNREIRASLLTMLR